MGCKCNYGICADNKNNWCTDMVFPCRYIPTRFAPNEDEFPMDYYITTNNDEYLDESSPTKKESLSETFKDSKSDYVKLAAAALDSQERYKDLRIRTLGLVDYAEGLEKFIKSILTEEGWIKFCDPEDAFGSVPNSENFRGIKCPPQ